MGDDSERTVWTIAVCSVCGEFEQFGPVVDDGGYYCAACRESREGRLVEVAEVQAERDGSARKTDSWYAGFDAGFKRGQEVGREGRAALHDDDWGNRLALAENVEALADALGHLEVALGSKSHTVQVMPGRWEILDEIGVCERVIYVQLHSGTIPAAGRRSPKH